MSQASSNDTKQQELQEIGILEFIVLVLSVYVLGSMLAEFLLPLDGEMRLLLEQIDFAVCMVFLLDFFVRFFRAKSKLRFMRWGWIDLLSSIPMVDPLRWGRLARVFRIIRVLRALGSTRRIIAFLYRRRMTSLAGSALLVTFLLLVFSCIAILSLENEEGSNIKTPSDAIWWAFTTITTVGYGDKFPVTMEGRAVAVVLMVAGISLFGIFTGLFAKLFIEPDVKREDSDIKILIDEVRYLRERIELMEEKAASPSDPGTRNTG
jgi:voltage-gated potassium channel